MQKSEILLLFFQGPYLDEFVKMVSTYGKVILSPTSNQREENAAIHAKPVSTEMFKELLKDIYSKESHHIKNVQEMLKVVKE